MTDAECVALLRWAMPRLGLRWRGFEHLRRQVCRRVVARARALGVDGDGYRALLAADEAELARFDALCFVTISRFYRDASTFDALAAMLPSLAGNAVLRVWSAGCASGEEPYTVAMLCERAGVSAEIMATDRDEAVLARAAKGEYEASSLRELPEDLRAIGFDGAVVRANIRERVEFRRADLRSFEPPTPLHVVLCRNAVFTYFDEATQRRFVERIARCLVPGGLLVIGKGESMAQRGEFLPAGGPLIWRAPKEMPSSE